MNRRHATYPCLWEWIGSQHIYVPNQHFHSLNDGKILANVVQKLYPRHEMRLSDSVWVFPDVFRFTHAEANTRADYYKHWHSIDKAPQKVQDWVNEMLVEYVKRDSRRAKKLCSCDRFSFEWGKQLEPDPIWPDELMKLSQ